MSIKGEQCVFMSPTDKMKRFKGVIEVMFVIFTIGERFEHRVPFGLDGRRKRCENLPFWRDGGGRCAASSAARVLWVPTEVSGAGPRLYK